MTAMATMNIPLSKQRLLDRIIRMERNLKYNWNRMTPGEKHDGSIIMETMKQFRDIAKADGPLSKQRLMDGVLGMERNLKYSWPTMTMDEKHDGSIIMEAMKRFKDLIESGEFDMAREPQNIDLKALFKGGQ